MENKKSFISISTNCIGSDAVKILNKLTQEILSNNMSKKPHVNVSLMIKLGTAVMSSYFLKEPVILTSDDLNDLIAKANEL